MDKRGGGVSGFSVGIFSVSECRKTSYGNPCMLCFRIFPVAKKVYGQEGGGESEFPWKFYCLTLPKTSVGEPFCVVFQKNSDSLKI